ncbi:MAG: hypothetical protein KDD11_18670 [Acidobacteria bacterium]|nr:hypothetical protein [Acidobacteriota bacterium]
MIRWFLRAGCIALGFCLLASVSEATSPWSELGPDGGEVVSFLVDGRTPGRLYVGTAAHGVFVSADGADSWRVSGLDTGRVVALAQGPQPEELYAAVGSDVLVSSDGGTTWTSTGFESELGARALASDGDTVYAGASEGLFRLEADGWVQVAPGVFGDPSTLFYQLLVAPDGALFAATLQGLFVSRDQGESFARLGQGSFSSASHVVPDPSSSVLFVSTLQPRAVFQSDAMQSQWHVVSRDLPGDLILQGFDIQLEGSSRLLVALSEQGFYRRRLPAGAWELPSAVPYRRFGADRLVAADPTSATLYAPGPAGLARSEDAGRTWQLASDGMHALALKDFAVADPAATRLYASGGIGSVFGSGDAADHWQLLAQPRFAVETPLAVDPRDPLTVYRGANGGVDRSSDGGQTWSHTEDGLVCNEIATLAVAPGRPSTLYAAGYSLTGACSLEFPDVCFSHRSTDGGVTWSCTAPLGLVLRFLVDPRDDLRVYALERDGLFRSEDGGETWAEVTAGLDGIFTDARMHPGRPDVLFLAAQDQVYRSYDRGDTWESTGGAPPEPISALAVHPAETRNLYALAGGHLYISTDQGAGWVQQSDPEGGLVLTGPLVVPKDRPRELYAGTTGGGIVRRPIPVQSTCVFGPTTHCLSQERFEVKVSWTDFQGRSGDGQTGGFPIKTGSSGAVPAPIADTGSFWFFRPSNIEILVKVIDGRPVNGHWWVFYGSLSNVEFDLVVKDTTTGDVREYHNPLHTFASRGDTQAFAAVSPTTGFAEQGGASPVVEELSAGPVSSGLIELSGAGGTDGTASAVRSLPDPEDTTCVSAGTTLCLHDRFRIRVRWEDFQQRTGDGHIENLTADTGAFWFFRDSNLELFLKVLDGRPVNGHWWVFYGALSNVAYTITVDDLVAGTQTEYFNPARHFGSRGDTLAF